VNAALRPEEAFDWREPDYITIFRERAERLNRMRAHPERLPALKAYYRDHIADFITDWGMTYSPWNAGTKQPPYLPFLLMPKQRELVDWMIRHWKERTPGLIEKSREIGCSWVAMAVSIGLCIFHEQITIGFGSATETKLDRSGDPDSLFWKGRMFIAHLPEEFRGGCNIEKDAPEKRILFPATQSSITGEVGDKIGFGGRKSIYVVDEMALVEHPKLMESGLSGNTDCRIDISTVSLDGMANEFSVRRHSGQVDVFTYHYRDDLRKDAEWAEAKKKTMDPIVWAANYEIDYMAAAEGVVIPQLWVQAAVGAFEKLCIIPSGARLGALDVADEGIDLNAFAVRYGNEVTHCESWPGKNSDPYFTAERAYMTCDEQRVERFHYDADGIGGSIRAAATRIDERRASQRMRKIACQPYKGSSAVFEPESFAPGTEVKNKDRFYNLKAQSWFWLRDLFWHTYRAINGDDYDASKLISLSRNIPELQKLCIELSQPQWKLSTNGKIVVDKTPEGIKSPDRGDSVCILFHPRARPMRISDTALEIHE